MLLFIELCITISKQTDFQKKSRIDIPSESNHRFDMSNSISYIHYTLIHLVSNYEVNTIIKSYLNIWLKHPKINYIYKSELEACFKPKNRGFVNHFFLSDEINCNDYILFVCFFLFYHKVNIINVLIAMSGVNSNLLITREKINNFLFMYDLNLKDYKDLEYFLSVSVDEISEYILLVYIIIVIPMMFIV